MTNYLRLWYLGLLPLLLSGACQRATYSFQAAPALARLAAVAPAPTLTRPATLAPAEITPLASAARRWQRARRSAPAQVQRPRPYPGGLARLAVRPLVRLVRPLATQVAPGQVPLPERTRSRGVAVLLAVIPALFGFPLGLHNFYLGYTGRGIISLLLFLTAFIFIFIGIAYFFFGVFFGVASTQAVLFLIGIAIEAGLTVWHLIDAILIATGNLLPRDGVYKPRFF